MNFIDALVAFLLRATAQLFRSIELGILIGLQIGVGLWVGLKVFGWLA